MMKSRKRIHIAWNVPNISFDEAGERAFNNSSLINIIYSISQILFPEDVRLSFQKLLNHTTIF